MFAWQHGVSQTQNQKGDGCQPHQKKPQRRPCDICFTRAQAA